jgi:N-acyl-D-amino-acid deacylase
MRLMKLFCGVLLVGLSWSCSFEELPPRDMTYDVLIRNATIVDGSGSPKYRGTVLIEDGLIAYVGTNHLSNYNATDVIEAAGRIVSPGFIDAHAHGNAITNSEFRNFWASGVTTILLGMDGSSDGVPKLTQWMSKVEEVRPGLNIVHLTGHGTARHVSGIGLTSNPDSVHIARLSAVVDTMMQQGSFGVSTGIEYVPGRFADRTELAAVGEVVARYNGIVMSHMRNEDRDEVGNSVRELIQMGRDSGARVHVSHIKVVYGNEIDDAEFLLAVMDSARSAGQPITADVYPYTASYTGIGILYPEWALPPNEFEQVKRTRRAELETYLRKRVELRNGPEATLMGTGEWSGRTLAEISDSLGIPFEQVLVDFMPPGSASAAYFVMNEAVMRRFFQSEHVVVSSDGSPTMLHPRGYGSFAKIIRQFGIEENLMPIEVLVHKMTGKTAELLGLDRDRIPTTSGLLSDLHYVRRGLLRAGYAADVVVFDAERVRDEATYEDPHRYATGFDFVFVNGILVQREGRPTGARPGLVLRAR